jgi:DNA-binding beta-propeller fold protein YncE
MPQETEFLFDVNAEWESLPDGISHADVAAVGVDSMDRVYLFTRNQSLVLVFTRDGSFITSWGEGVFANPHGLTVGPDDAIYCVDSGDHTVRKFTPDGDLLMTIGTPGSASDTGYQRGPRTTVHHVEFVDHPGPPFNRCTNLAVAPNGDLYVADGYGNCRVHRFSPHGDLLGSWGDIGVGPGQFHLPHGIAVGPDERVYVCDRENDRIQIFDPLGGYVAEWTDVQRPDDIAFDANGYAYVAELWRPRGAGSFTHGIMREDHPGRVSVYDAHGGVAARWGASTVNREAPGNFIAPHGIALDSAGDLYVAEVAHSQGRICGFRPRRPAHQIQKFSRVAPPDEGER